MGSVSRTSHGDGNNTVGRDAVETQVRVGKVLSAFDDKIELNAQINHNLEGIAA